MISDSRQRVQIFGSGGVGSFLANELNSELNDISFVDSRPNSKSIGVHSFAVEGIYHSYPKKIDFSENVNWNFICTKSYNISDELVANLSKLNGKTIFIQNGRVLTERYYKLEGNFIFANFASLDVQMNNNTLHVNSHSPEILISSRGLSYDSINKIRGLFQSTNIQVKFFQDYNAVLLEKYPRWMLTNLLTITSQKSIGFAIKSMDRNELEVMSGELTRILSEVLEVQIDLNSLLKQLASLPTDLTTSSYRDYLSGNQCEFLIEMKHLVESAHLKGISCPTLVTILERL